MTEEFRPSEATNLDNDQPIDLSKNSRTLFQERIRREAHRPVPQLIPLNLLPSFKQIPHEVESKPEPKESDTKLEHLNRVNMTIQPGRSRLARVQSYPYLFEKRRLCASQKSKSDSRISVHSAQQGSSSMPAWNVNNNSEKFSQLVISSSGSQRSLTQGFSLDSQRVMEKTSYSEDLRLPNQDLSLRPSFFSGNIRRGAGASPSTINSLRNFLQKKQQIQQMPDTSCSSTRTS